MRRTLLKYLKKDKKRQFLPTKKGRDIKQKLGQSLVLRDNKKKKSNYIKKFIADPVTGKTVGEPVKYYANGGYVEGE